MENGSTLGMKSSWSKLHWGWTVRELDGDRAGDWERVEGECAGAFKRELKDFFDKIRVLGIDEENSSVGHEV